MTQLWLPPRTHAVPDDFKRWLHERYGDEVKILWDRKLNRFALAHLNRKSGLWRPFKLLQREDGTFLPPCDEAKRIIAESVCHVSEARRFEQDVDREVQRLKAKERANDAEMIRYTLRSNLHRLGGSPRSTVFLGNV
jgi:hypothetical protein